MSEKGSHLIDMDKVLTRDRSGIKHISNFLREAALSRT